MKLILVFLNLFALSRAMYGDVLTPSVLDPKGSEAREKAFTPWSDPDQNGENWRKLAGSNVPIYNERKAGNLSRDLYIPNPGIGYWVLGNLSEEELWKTEREKLKIGDELVSASVYQNESGETVYWALWAPRNRAYLLKEKMRDLGIKPASVDIDQAAQDEDNRGKRLDAATLYTFTGEIAFHDSEGNVRYDLTVTKGQVKGWQHWRDEEKPVGEIVGGWFDFDRRRLSVLVQGADHVEAQWRSQIKQFHIDIPAKQVILDYEMHDYGHRNETSPVGAPHILDKFDKLEHLLKPAKPGE